MTETTDRPGIAERYRRSINSSDLRVRERIQGDADLLMAAGWTSGLGTMLYRLASEYDQVKGDVLKTQPNDKTGALLILMQLKSLAGTKEALGRFAWEMSAKRGYDLSDKDVAVLTGRVLVAWLDPNCHVCSGRGTVGSAYEGKPSSICRACSGSGKARLSIGQTQTERAFVGFLMGEMDRMQTIADGRLRRYLKRV
jgi:hypothetical protein